MKKNYLILLLAGIALLPVSLNAQQSTKTFDEQYLEKAKLTAIAEAQVTAALLRKSIKET